MRVKYIIWAVALTALFAAALLARGGLDGYADIFTVTYQGEDYGVVTRREAADSATVYTSGGLRAECNGRAVDGVSRHSISNTTALLPLNITNGDAEISADSAVIGYELAWRLFSTADCAGQAFTLDGKVYTVSGVYRQSLKDALSAREQYAVYVAYNGNAAPHIEQTYMARAKPGTAALLLSRWERSTLNVSRAVNLDANARLYRFAADVLLIAGLIILWRGAFLVFKKAAKRSKRRRIALGALAGLAAVAVLCVWRVRFGMDPRFIPDSVMEPGDYIDAFRRWNILNNRHYLRGGPLSARLTLDGWIAVLTSAAFLVTAWAAGRRVKKYKEAGE